MNSFVLIGLLCFTISIAQTGARPLVDFTEAASTFAQASAIASLDAAARDVRFATYSYPRAVDPLLFNVHPNATKDEELFPTQIKGSFYFPRQDSQQAGSVPLVFLFPGRHSDCRSQINVPGYGLYPYDYGQTTTQGECPFNNNTIIESNRGFDYLGQALASYGFAAISIDPLTINRLDGRADDSSLNRARARLIFRTIEKAQQWNSQANTSVAALGFDVSGKLDFQNIGIMGHSRGGMAARIAYNIINRTSPVFAGELYDWAGNLDIKIKAVFEIAPYEAVEYGTQNVIASGIPWGMIAAGCEDDVIDFSYLRLYQRQATENREPNHFINVYGASHDYFNSQWPEVLDTCIGDQTPTWDVDAPTFPYTGQDGNYSIPLVTGSPSQRLVAQWAVTTFMRSYVGPQADVGLAKDLEAGSPIPAGFANGTEIGRANPNFAVSEIINPMRSADGILVSPAPASVQSIPERAESQFSLFREQLNRSSPVVIFTPPYLVPRDVSRVANTISGDPGIGIQLSDSETDIKIPIASSVGTGLGTEGCAIHIDIARRDSCFLASSGAARKTCSSPRLLNAEITAGKSRSLVTTLKSRYSMEFTQQFDYTGTDTDPPDFGFLPISWETVTLPCPSTLPPELQIVLSAASAYEAANSTSTVIYLGPVRLVNR